MKILFLDCFSGVSGDKFAAALLDMGLPLWKIEEGLEKLGFDDHAVEAEKRLVGHVRCSVFRVLEDAPAAPRKYAEICRILEQSQLSQDIKAVAKKIFDELARAEAAVHGLALEELSFHELGALDTIADALAAAIGLSHFRIEKVVCSPIPTGRGMVKTKHGVIPIPAPATLELLKNVPTYQGEVEGELTTPTGAAIIKALAHEFGPMPEMRIASIGYGAGSRDLPIPNYLRAVIGEKEESTEQEEVVLLATNVDDDTGEMISNALEALLNVGCLDAWVSPIYMKKGRPAYEVRALCRTEHKDAALKAIYRNTTTFGVRIQAVERHHLSRCFETIEIGGENVRVKVGFWGNELFSITPEFEDCKMAAAKTGIPLKDVMSIAREEARKRLEKDKRAPAGPRV